MLPQVANGSFEGTAGKQGLPAVPSTQTLGRTGNRTYMQCFISHASEDKDSFVRELAHALRRKGRRVWYDEFSLKPGDSLRRSIDAGLAQCDLGVVVLSPAFFAKEWPQRELDALLNAEIGGTKKLLSVWHEIDAATVARHSPLLADKIVLKSSLGASAIADALAKVIPHNAELSGHVLATAIELHLSHETMVDNFLREGCKYRFFQLQSYFASCQALMDEALVGAHDEEIDARIDEALQRLEPTFQALERVHDVPTDVEVLREEPIPDARVEAWLQGFEDWVAGTAGEEETASLLADIDIYFEIDALWLFFGLPNFAVSEQQREILDEAIVIIGSAIEREAETELRALCQRLRAMDAQGAA